MMKNSNWLRTLLCLALVLCTVLALCACPATVPPDPGPGETPGGETPGGETPGGETPGGETPGGETPGGETPGGETPGDDPVLPDVDPVEGTPLYSEMWRPAYHFTSENSWINDPNGLTYFNGVYHIYYQMNPGIPNHGTLHWGHAVSTDLVHFTELEPALYPEFDTPDAAGHMFSGTGYADTENRSGFFDGVEGGGIILAYSAQNTKGEQNIGIAYSTDGQNYTKLGIVLENGGIKDFRDPKLFWDEISGKWTMIVAGGQVRFYQSSNLRDWNLISTNNIWTECPDFFPMTVEGTDTVKWVLTLGGRYAYIGSWNGTRFTPESDKISLNYGYDNYAGIIFSADKDDRILMMNWMNNWYYQYPTEPDGQWSGAMTLINELKLYKEGKNYRITQTPIEEYETIYEDELISLPQFNYQGENPFAAVNSQTYLLEFTIDLGSASDFTIHLYDSEDESVDLIYDAESRSLTLDRSKSVLGIDLMKGAVIPDDGNNLSIQTMTIAGEHIGGDGLIDVQVYVDTSSVEVYACNNTYVLTSRTQPMTSSRGLTLEAENGLWLLDVKVTQLANIHFEDMTLIDSIHPETEIVKSTMGIGTWKYTLRDVKTPRVDIKAEEPLFYRIMTFKANSPITAECVDPSIAAVEVTEGGLLIRGLKEGKTQIKVSTRYNYIFIPVEVVYDRTFSSQLDNFSVDDGLLEKRQDGYLFSPTDGANAYALSDTYLTDFTYTADITFLENAGTASLLFRAKNTSNFYGLSLDPAGDSVKLWVCQRGKGTDLSVVTYDFNIGESATYIIKIVAEGSSIVVYINGEEVLSTTDTTHDKGYLGLGVSMETANFNYLTYEDLSE